MKACWKKTGIRFSKENIKEIVSEHSISGLIIPARRVRYLSEITDEIRSYNQLANEQAAVATKLYQVSGAIAIINENNKEQPIHSSLTEAKEHLEKQLLPVM